MDNFIDKIAQKFNAQDAVKAASQAESAKRKHYEQQAAVYDKLVQEFRKLDYRDTEISDRLDSLKDSDTQVLDAIKGLADSRDEGLAAERERLEADKARFEEEKRQAAEREEKDNLQKISQMVDERLKQSEDFLHKESVKVYRNVQAVVADEAKSANDTISMENTAVKSKLKVILVISIISLAASLGGVILSALSLLTAMGITLF